MAKAFIVVGVISCFFNNLLNGEKKVFEISSYDTFHDDERENEIFKAVDFFNPRILKRDENKYQPLHSHVKQYNQRMTKAKMQIPNVLYNLKSNKRRIFNLLPDAKSNIVGFKDRLMARNIYNRKLNNYQEEDSSPLFNINIEEINKYIQSSSTISTESTLEPTDEYIYDYNAIRISYEQTTEKHKYINDTLSHKKEQMVKESGDKITSFNDTINCTKKDISYFNTIKCLFSNYQYMKNKPATKKLISNTWLIIKIWLCIYVCIAIPCWCQRGWCCCCFRCKICFPRKRIMFAKQYYIRNPPGFLMPKFSKKKSIKYEPSEVEEEMYEQFETAIRNI